MIPTPNGREESGTSRDCFILNPQLASQASISAYRFLGILMGIAIRTGSPLSLNLAEPMWKLLAGSQLNPSDITEIDKVEDTLMCEFCSVCMYVISFQDYVSGLMCIRDSEPDSNSFAAMVDAMPFSTPSAAGQEVQLSAR